MTLFQSFALGVLQGLTEFLPVSSSGHLVLLELVLHVHLSETNMQGFNILLHAGTLAALLIVYGGTWLTLGLAPLRRDRRNTMRLLLLIIATIPGAAAGFFLEDWIAGAFQSALTVGIAFAATGIILIVGERWPQRQRTVWHRVLHPTEDEPRKLTTRSALYIGIAQALALVPGLSRSGLTISAGRMIGLERRDALDFSFLMAMPIIAGATALSLKDVVSGALTLPPANIVAMGVATSFAFSAGAILFLRAFVVSRSLAWFSPYLFAASVACIFFSLR